MPKSKQQSINKILNTLAFAKKMSERGLDLLGQSRVQGITKLDQQPERHQVIDGEAKLKSQYDQVSTSHSQYLQPQQMLRAHLPTLSKQLLGRHYNKMSMLSHWVSPQLNDVVADYLFEHLNDAVSQWSSVETVLQQTGEKKLQALAGDVSRSNRISHALSNQNRLWAATQGGISGLLGVLGASLDVPCSLALALRGIYQTGRAYGFELGRDDHAVVEYVFKHIDFASLAEKQALMAVLRSAQEILEQHDFKQLQQLLGSSNDAEFLNQFLFDEQGQLKWSWLSNMPQLNLLTKLTRLGGAGVGAFYSIKLVDVTSEHANAVFSQARQYLIEHPEQTLDPLAAYLAAQHALQTQPVAQIAAGHQDIVQIRSQAKISPDATESAGQHLSADDEASNTKHDVGQDHAAKLESDAEKVTQDSDQVSDTVGHVVEETQVLKQAAVKPRRTTKTQSVSENSEPTPKATAARTQSARKSPTNKEKTSREEDTKSNKK